MRDTPEGSHNEREVCGKVVTLSPTESNAVVEDKLEHLEPVLENARGVLEQLHADLKNGKFTFKKLWARMQAAVEESE